MKSVPEKETLTHIAELFKGFADPTRVHILCLLLNVIQSPAQGDQRCQQKNAPPHQILDEE